MKLLVAFTRAAYQKTAVYRLDFWAGQLSNFVMMAGGYYLWLALYENRPEAFGVTVSQMTTYGVLGMLLQPIMGTSGDIQRYLAQQVRLGTLETDVMKPVDFVLLMFSRNMGDFLVELLLHGLPGLLFAYLFLDFPVPTNWQTAVSFPLSLLMGYITFFWINLLLGLLAIITLDIRSYMWAFSAIIRFASGQLVPLWLYPPALATLFAILPFQSIFFAPISIYIGAETAVVPALLRQLAWTVALFFVVRWVWSRLYQRITIQGG